MLRKGLLRMEEEEEQEQEQQQKEREESSNNTKITTITATVVASEKEKGVNNLVTLEKENNNKDSIDNNAIPLEIDIHFQMYGKHAWDVEYGEERCQICDRRIDEYGFCACGSQGD
jgi:Zn-dependent metalloprotease